MLSKKESKAADTDTLEWHLNIWIYKQYIECSLSYLLYNPRAFWAHRKCHPRMASFHNNNWEFEETI